MHISWMRVENIQDKSPAKPLQEKIPAFSFISHQMVSAFSDRLLIISCLILQNFILFL